MPCNVVINNLSYLIASYLLLPIVILSNRLGLHASELVLHVGIAQTVPIEEHALGDNELLEEVGISWLV